MTYKEEYEAMEAFFEKCESAIVTAPRNSLLGMIHELDEAMTDIEGAIVDDRLPDDDPYLTAAKQHITHVALLLAQMWSDEES